MKKKYKEKQNNKNQMEKDENVRQWEITMDSLNKSQRVDGCNKIRKKRHIPEELTGIVDKKKKERKETKNCERQGGGENKSRK